MKPSDKTNEKLCLKCGQHTTDEASRCPACQGEDFQRVEAEITSRTEDRKGVDRPVGTVPIPDFLKSNADPRKMDDCEDFENKRPAAQPPQRNQWGFHSDFLIKILVILVVFFITYLALRIYANDIQMISMNWFSRNANSILLLITIYTIIYSIISWRNRKKQYNRNSFNEEPQENHVSPGISLGENLGRSDLPPASVGSHSRGNFVRNAKKAMAVFLTIIVCFYILILISSITDNFRNPQILITNPVFLSLAIISLILALLETSYEPRGYANAHSLMNYLLRVAIGALRYLFSAIFLLVALFLSFLIAISIICYSLGFE